MAKRASKENLSSIVSERRRKVVDAAAQLFAHQGFHGTNTREIANVAGISENTLFRYFESKEEVFWAAIRSRLREFEWGADLMRAIAAGDEPEVVLPLILTKIIDAVTLQPEALQLLVTAFIDLRWKAQSMVSDQLLPSLTALNRYLAINIENGKLRADSSSILTAALASSVLVQPELGRLLGEVPKYSNRREAINAYSRFWLDLLLRSR